MATTNSGIKIRGSTITVCTGASTLLTGTLNTSETITPVPEDEAFADLELECAFATAPAAGKFIHVYRRDINMSAAGKNAPLPVVTDYEEKYCGSFAVLNSTAAQVLSLPGILIPHDAEFYIKNDTGQTMSAGYVLRAMPWSWGPAP